MWLDGRCISFGRLNHERNEGKGKLNIVCWKPEIFDIHPLANRSRKCM